MGLLHKLPRLQFCCCCIDLRTGAVILGALGILCNVVIILEILRDMDLVNFRAEALRDNGYDPNDVKFLVWEAKRKLISFIVSSLVSLLISLLLLIGAFKRNKTLLAIYLYINLSGVGVILVLSILALFVLPKLYVILYTVLIIAVLLYYLFCVNSYYLLLDEEHNRLKPSPDQNESAI